jgi:hypothetical protein
MIKVPTTILAAFALLGATAAAKADPYVVTFTEATGAASCDGASTCVVATGSGQIDLTGLTGGSPENGFVPGFVYPSGGWIFTGAGGDTDVYSVVRIQDFGSGGFTEASSASGDNVGIQAAAVLVPAGYVSGTALSDSAIYDNVTFADLGLTPGTYGYRNRPRATCRHRPPRGYDRPPRWFSWRLRR